MQTLPHGARPIGELIKGRQGIREATLVRVAQAAKYGCRFPGERQTMSNYETIIYWSNEDNVVVADVPALPGCAAHGGSQEKARRFDRNALACDRKLAARTETTQ